MISIFPSLISSNILCLQKEIEQLEPYCSGFHLDVMDFHFVPNLTWGPSFINAIRQATNKQLFIHLMVDYPERYFPLLKLYSHDIVAVHIESPSEYSLNDLIVYMQDHNWTSSVALNPSTPLEVLIARPVLPDQIVLMSVQPGFSGQQFLPHVLDKTRALYLWRQAHNLSFSIALDGGITTQLAQKLVQEGADQLALAQAIFGANNTIKALQNITKAAEVGLNARQKKINTNLTL